MNKLRERRVCCDEAKVGKNNLVDLIKSSKKIHAKKYVANPIAINQQIDVTETDASLTNVNFVGWKTVFEKTHSLLILIRYYYLYTIPTGLDCSNTKFHSNGHEQYMLTKFKSFIVDIWFFRWIEAPSEYGLIVILTDPYQYPLVFESTSSPTGKKKFLNKPTTSLLFIP